MESRGKARYQKMYDMQLYQLVVRVEDCRGVKSISMKKVGTFFRSMATVRLPSSFLDIPPLG